MLDESIHRPDDQIYRELIRTVLQSDTQLSDVTTEELISLVEKLLTIDDDFEPNTFITGWLRYAL